jgi:hypothetical protein
MDSFKNLHGSNEFVNEKTGRPESFSERTARLVRERDLKASAEILELKRTGKIPLSQKEQRELKRQQRQAEVETATLTKQDILAKCGTDGFVKVTVSALKNAFPSMISQIAGNAYRTQIDNKQFHEFLLNNNLTFSLPDLVFKKQI